MFENLKNHIKHTIKMNFARFGVDIRLKSSLQNEATVKTASISPFPTYGILKPANLQNEVKVADSIETVPSSVLTYRIIKPSKFPPYLDNLTTASEDILSIELERLFSSSKSQQSIQERIAIQQQFRRFLHFFCTGEDPDEDYQLMLLQLEENLAGLIDFARTARLPDRCHLFALGGSRTYYLFGDRYYSKDSPLCARLVALNSPIPTPQQTHPIKEGMEKIAIDYPQHPGFAKLDRVGETDAEIEEKIQEINGLVEVAKIALSNTETYPQTIVLEMICKPVKQLFNAISRKSSDVERFAEFLETLYDRTIDGLCRDIAQSHYRGKYTGTISSSESMNVSYTLDRQGFFLKKITPQLLEEFDSLLTPYKEKIKANYARGLTSRTALSINQIDRKVVDCLHNLFERLGIIEGVSNYVGSKVRIGFALELSVPNSMWWRSRYLGLDCETENTAYFHTDEAPEIPKAILYLSEVQPDNGPFTFIPDSYQWKRSALPWVISRIIDGMGNLMKYPDLPDDDSYDRNLLASSLGRQHFLLLPPSLRFVTHFGNDVLTNTELENYLVDRSYSITSNIANCTIFDGGRLVHRGGLVQQGERWACQIVFVGENEYTNSLMKGWRDWVN